MAKGDTVLASKHNSAVNAVNDCRAKWKGDRPAPAVGSGGVVTASAANQLLNWLNECKSASGWGGTIGVSSKVVGNYLVDEYDRLISDANTIRNYCACNGNCTGGCSGTCRARCRNSCSRSCANSTASKSGQ